MTLRKFFMTLAGTLALLAFGHAANAAPMTLNLAVEVVEGPGLGEMGTLDISFDDADLTGSGTEELAQSQIELALDLFGLSFTNNDDVGFPDYPRATFTNGMLTFIDFIVPVLDPIDAYPAVLEIRGGAVSDDTWLVVAHVPVPAAAWLFGSALLGLGAAARRQRSAR